MTPMPHSSTGTLLGHIRTLAAKPRDSRSSDRELLLRFAAERDEDAFTTLMQRHGPMVWRVCRRLLQASHSAADAFQATFLVLAPKTATVRWRKSVGNWLYGVAYRLANRARADAARRRARESHVTPKPPADPLA